MSAIARNGTFFGDTKKDFGSCAKQSEVLRKIPGTVLLSHSQIYSTIAAGVLNDRVREGNECFYSAMDTGKNHNEESLEDDLFEKNLSDETYKALTKVERDLFHGASGEAS